MIVLDTHALIWWVSDPSQLSAKAKQAITKAKKTKSIAVSAISFWEIAMLVNKGRLTLTIPVEDWLDQVSRLPEINIIPIDHSIALKAVGLKGLGYSHDPADRFITATAHGLKATLISKDQKLQQAKAVKVFW